mgnify:CR=1 FL=1
MFFFFFFDDDDDDVNDDENTHTRDDDVIKMTSFDVVNDFDFNNKRAKALEEVFDAVARYGEMREKHERTTREAMMSIAAARYALGRVGWESVVGTTTTTTAIFGVTNEEEEEEEEEGREEKRKATCVVALREDNEGGRVFETSFVRAMMNPKEEEEKEEEEEEEESERTKMEPAQARVVRRKFRELTRASAEVLSIKSALERKVKRYEREYGSAM